MSVDIPEEIYQAITASGQDVSEFVESAVRQALAKSPHSASEQQPPISFYEAAKESGLIGGGSEFLSDLSTNPKHMEGFGE